MSEFNKVFESENIIFVNLSEELIDDYLSMVNDPEIANKIRRQTIIFTPENEKEWVQSKLKEKAYCYSMIEKATNKFIGNVEIMNIENNNGELGICITSSQQDKHLGTESMLRLIKYALEEVKLDGVNLNVYRNNPRAIYLYKKLGFIEEGGDEYHIHMIYKGQKENDNEVRSTKRNI